MNALSGLPEYGNFPIGIITVVFIHVFHFIKVVNCLHIDKSFLQGTLLQLFAKDRKYNNLALKIKPVP
jgi:hypothetical protein